MVSKKQLAAVPFNEMFVDVCVASRHDDYTANFDEIEDKGLC